MFVNFAKVASLVYKDAIYTHPELGRMHIFTSCVLVAITAYAMYFIQRMNEPKLLPIVEGFFQPEFMPAANYLRHNMESGRERGAALAVYHDGEIVVDMWAGYADPDSLTRWRNGTTTLVFDCTKAVLAVMIARLVDRGVLNYSMPVSQYWPDFGKHGKGEITLEQLLSHQARLPFLSEPLSLRDLQTDRKKVDKLLISQIPIGKPGSQFGYHSQTYGLYLDRLVQVTDQANRDVATVFEEEIASKHDIQFSLNVKKGDFYKTARLGSVSMATTLVQLFSSPTYLKLFRTSMFDTQSIYSKTVNTVKELALSFTALNNPELREITLTSFSGTGTARGLAKLFGLLTVQRRAGEYFLSPETLDKLTEPLSGDVCNVTGLPKTFGRGVQIFNNPYGEPVFGHAGEGGQMVMFDPKNKLSIAFLTNHLSIYGNGDDSRYMEIQKHIYSNLDRYIKRKRVHGG